MKRAAFAVFALVGRWASLGCSFRFAVWWFFAAAAGAQTAAPVDHFLWNGLPSAIVAGQPVAAGVQAVDVAANFTTNFNGPVQLTAMTSVPPPVLWISEVETITTKRVELANTTTNPVSIGRWRVTFFDQQSWPLPKTSYTIPVGTWCPAGGLFEVRGGGYFPGTFPVHYTGANLTWSSQPAGNPVAVLLQDAGGMVVDFFCAVDARPPLISTPVQIADTTWNGPPVPPNANPALTYQRTGYANHHNSADWIIAPNRFGLPNPALSAPVSGLVSVSAVTPPTVSLTNGAWSGIITVATPGTNLFLRADDGAGQAGDSGLLTVASLPGLVLQVPHQAYKATPGLLGQGTLSIPFSLSNDLVVVLSNTLPGLISVPASVLLAAGTNSATFPITNFYDGLIEGPQTASILAAAPGFAPASAGITNYDRPPVLLTVTAASSVGENVGWVSGAQVHSSPVASVPVAVQLSSSNPNKLQVPDFVWLPAGQSVVNFGFAVLDNHIYDGNQSVVVTATVTGWSPGQTSVLVVDNENTNLYLSLPSQVVEGSGVLSNAGTLQLSAVFPTNILVALASDLTNKLLVPATVLVAAGQTSASFSLTLPEDSLADGDQAVQLTASASGFASRTGTVTVVDNHIFSFSVSSLPAAQVAGQPFVVTINALNQTGTVVPGYSSTVSLAASGMAGGCTVTPAIAGPFTNGVWSGCVTVPAPNHSLTLAVSDGLGHGAVSTPFDVISTTIINLPTADLAYDASRNTLLAGVISNATGNGQSVIPLDPGTGTLGTPIPIGADPSQLAISDNDAYLYTSLEINSTGGVARVNLSLHTVDLRFAVGGPNQYGQIGNYIEDMKVQPGNPHTLVATTKIVEGYDQYIAVYDDGIQRSNVVWPNYYVRTYHLAFGDSPAGFYITKPNGIWLNSITPQGANFLQEIAGSQYGADMVYAGGFLYTTAGQIFNTNDFSLAGQFPVAGAVIPDPQQGRVFFLTQSGSLTTFWAFDRSSLSPLATLNLPAVSGQVGSFVKTGPNRFAFRTTGSQVYLLDTSFMYTNALADLSASLVVAPTQPVLGSNLNYSITISNSGPASSYGVMLTNQIPVGATFVSASVSSGTWNYAGGQVSCSLGNLTNGQVALVTIVVQPTLPGLALDQTALSAITPDPAPANNFLTDVRPVQVNAAGSAITQVTLPNNDLAFDPATQCFFASVPPTDYGWGNSLVSFNPLTGQFSSPVPVGGGPAKLAIANSGMDLYVGLDAEASVRHFNTVTLALDPSFSIGANNVAADLAVRPGAPQTVAVSRYDPLAQSFANTALYDDGVARPESVQSPGIQFSPDGQILYAYGWNGPNLPNTSGDAFFVNQVVPSGLVTTSGWQAGSFLGVGAVVASGFAYYGNGSVLDLSTFAYTPRFAGIIYSPLVCVDGTTNRIFFLFNNGTDWVLNEFDRITYALVGSLVIPGVSGNPNRLLSWGTNGVAFGTSSNQVFLVQEPLIPRVAQVAVTQSALPALEVVGSNEIYSIVVTNRGPGDAQNVMLTDYLPDAAMYLSASSPQGVITQNQGVVTFSLGTLPKHTALALTITVVPGIGGFNLNSNSVTADLLDTSSGQNASGLYQWVSYGPTPALIQELRHFPTANLAYNSSNQTLLASVAGPMGSLSNSLVILDAGSCALQTYLPLANTPGQLALSSDDQSVYAALVNTGAVSQISLASGLPVQTFSLGTTPGLNAGDLQAVPGQPNSVAVSVNQYYYNSSVTIYDQGVPRPQAVGPGQFASTYPIRFGASANILYSILPLDLRTISVDSAGTHLVRENSQLVPDYSTAFEYDGGLLYFQSGRVVNPITQTFAPSFPVSGAVAPDSANGLIYFATTSGYMPFSEQVTIRAFPLNSTNELWSVPLPVAAGSLIQFLKLGTNGLAVLTDAGRIFILRAAQLPPPTADLSLTQTITPSPAVVNSNLTCTLTIQNHGPWAATGIVVSNPIPVGASFVSASSSQGTCLLTNGVLLANLGSLINGATATVTLRLSPTSVGALTNFATVTRNELDADPTNDSATAVVLVNPPPGLPRISIGDTTVIQGTGETMVFFQLTSSAASTAPITVGYRTTDGTAMAGQDYDPASGVATFGPGQTSCQLNLFIIRSNASAVSSSKFYLNLTSVTNATLARTQAVATIVKQVFRTLSIAGASVRKGNSGFSNAVFQLAISAASPVPVSVQYQTLDLTATAGTDYLARAGTLVFQPGATNAVLSVPVIGNALVASNKIFVVLLSQPLNAVLGANEAFGTIAYAGAFPAVRITGVHWAATNLWLDFSTIQGRRYRIEKADELASGVWTSVADQIPGTGGQMTVSNACSSSVSSQFYRLVLLP